MPPPCMVLRFAPTDTMDITPTRARPMATTGLSGSRTESSSARARGSAGAFTAGGAFTVVTSAGAATLMTTGAGSTGAETSAAGVTSVADGVASFTADLAVTSTVVEASTEVMHSAAAAVSTAEEVSMVAAVLAEADADRFLDSSTPPDGRQHALPAVSFWFGLGSKAKPFYD